MHNGLQEQKKGRSAAARRLPCPTVEQHQYGKGAAANADPCKSTALLGLKRTGCSLPRRRRHRLLARPASQRQEADPPSLRGRRWSLAPQPQPSQRPPLQDLSQGPLVQCATGQTCARARLPIPARIRASVAVASADADIAAPLATEAGGPDAAGAVAHEGPLAAPPLEEGCATGASRAPPGTRDDDARSIEAGRSASPPLPLSSSRRRFCPAIMLAPG